MVEVDTDNKIIKVHCTNKEEFIDWLRSTECTKLVDKYKRFQIKMEVK